MGYVGEHLTLAGGGDYGDESVKDVLDEFGDNEVTEVKKIGEWRRQ